MFRLRFLPLGAAAGGLSADTGCELHVPKCLPSTSPWGQLRVRRCGVFVRRGPLIQHPVPLPFCPQTWWGVRFLRRQVVGWGDGGPHHYPPAPRKQPIQRSLSLQSAGRAYDWQRREGGGSPGWGCAAPSIPNMKCSPLPGWEGSVLRGGEHAGLGWDLKTRLGSLTSLCLELSWRLPMWLMAPKIIVI